MIAIDVSDPLASKLNGNGAPQDCLIHLDNIKIYFRCWINYWKKWNTYVRISIIILNFICFRKLLYFKQCKRIEKVHTPTSVEKNSIRFLFFLLFLKHVIKIWMLQVLRIVHMFLDIDDVETEMPGFLKVTWVRLHYLFSIFNWSILLDFYTSELALA